MGLGRQIDSPGLSNRCSHLADFSSLSRYLKRRLLLPVRAPRADVDVFRAVAWHDPAGCRSGGTGAGEVALVSKTGGASALSKAVGRASINSSNARPLDVIFHPPLIRLTNPCEKMSRSGTLAARAPGPVRPVAATRCQDGHIPLEVLHHGKAVRISYQIFRTVT